MESRQKAPIQRGLFYLFPFPFGALRGLCFSGWLFLALGCHLDPDPAGISEYRLIKPLPLDVSPNLKPSIPSTHPPVSIDPTHTGPCLQMPAHIELPPKSPCTQETFTITLTHNKRPDCPAITTLREIRFQTSASAHFSLRSAPRTPYKLQRGQSLQFKVAYTPKEYVLSDASLSVATDNPQQAQLLTTLQAPPPQLSVQRDRFHQLPLPKDDVLLVINSHPSTSQLAKFHENLPSLQAWNNEYTDTQVGVISTDTSGTRYPAGCLLQGNGSAGRIAHSQDKDFLARILANAAIPENPHDNAQGLAAIKAALSSQRLHESQCNRGFLRDGAALRILVVSAPMDRSPEDIGEYRRFLLQIQQRTNMPNILIDSVIMPANVCSFPTFNCQKSDRYAQISLSFRGIHTRLDTSCWACNLMRIPILTERRFREQFFLTQQPDPKTLSVFVNGSRVAPMKRMSIQGWFYDLASNSILFGIDTIPPPDAIIDVMYIPACIP